MLRLCTFPECEVDRVMLLVLSVQCTGRIQHILDIATGKDPVVMIFVVFLYIEINGAFAFVGISVVEDLFTSSICSMMCPEACGSILGGSTLRASIALW